MPLENMILVVLVLLLIIIAMSGCSLLYLLLRNSRYSGSGGTATGADMTNQMILFQSMRETVEQQKELARQLNFSIDKKVEDVREIVRSASSIDQRISGAEQQLETLIHDTKEELKSLNRRMGYVKDQAGFPQDDEPEPVVESAPDITPDEPEVEEIPIASVIDAQGNEVPYDGSQQLPPLESIASNKREKNDFVDSWVGVDFGVRTLEELAPVLPEEPQEPEDAEASRDAFRTLLNLKESKSTEDRIEQTGKTTGRDVELTPLQRRIYEFSDSGMRVPDITRELGVGKGEVKLILNMRKAQA